MSTKIYAVTIQMQSPENRTLAKVRLIRAKTKAGAISFAASSHIEAALPTQDELVKLVSNGHKVEDAITTGQPQLPGTDPS
jgi:hypothetical protein